MTILPEPAAGGQPVGERSDTNERLDDDGPRAAETLSERVHMAEN